jgi:hypothetical protein
MTTKILPSLQYGSVVWRKIATMSAFIFDQENEELLVKWLQAHPLTFFRTASVEHTDREGVFHVWLPLLDDNKDWKMPYDKYRRGKDPEILPSAYDHNVVQHWLTIAEPFVVEMHIKVKNG